MKRYLLRVIGSNGHVVECESYDEREEAEAEAFGIAAFTPYRVDIKDNLTGKYLRGLWE